jgi:predicted membrane chloride channel (bestrophin family)
MEPAEREYRRMQRILSTVLVLSIPAVFVSAVVTTLVKSGIPFQTCIVFVFGAVVWFSIRTNLAYLRWDKRRPFWWPWR